MSNNGSFWKSIPDVLKYAAGIVGGLAALAVAVQQFGSNCGAGSRPGGAEIDETEFVPLKLYWHSEREDNFTTATPQGVRDAQAAGYTFARVEGYVRREPQAGLVPLKLYWHSEREDNFTTATAQGVRDAEAAGYTFARVEGYVQREPQAGLVPLKLYWHSEREDNFTTATAQGVRDAQAAGYTFARIEGYVRESR